MENKLVCNMLNSIVPISRFYKEESNKIFDEVNKCDYKVVVKNDKVISILMTPEAYQERIEKFMSCIESEKRRENSVESNCTLYGEQFSKYKSVQEDFKNIDEKIESNLIVPVSRFNRGEENEIFDEVIKSGCKIIVKNNKPVCILITPAAYEEIIEDYELCMEVEKRMGNFTESDLISQEEMLSEFGITQKELDSMEEYDLEFETSYLGIKKEYFEIYKWILNNRS